MSGIDLTTTIGSVTLPNPVMTASGTAGHGTELGAYVDLSSLGAVVVKSLAAYPWDGNPALRTHGTHGGMINSVGLQGPGVEAWRREQLPRLVDAGARVVASIWGRSIDDYRRAAEQLAGCPSEVVAVEINLSCPNTEAGGELLAHDPEASAATVEAVAAAGLPRWAKLSPNTSRVAEVAAAVHAAGAEAVTLVNTLLGMAIDPVSGAYRLGSGERGGGVSGPSIHPVAVRIVHDVHRALPELPVIGVGGIATGEDAVEMLRAGATAVQVGTATFADPRTVAKVLAELTALAGRIGVARVADLTGAVRPPTPR
ncbi:dihydroorotate dehydrogenase [Acidimicrobiia bacterium EGI L10123]|uniref:dihydroorotate dehydrogenase n=1 Tax=Salinilacustrithrix flava TaxID=2957203 RepID=UPI003D7C35CA|nr:dihydroorotate dehydrogenase [Acidimicrobiia bacterium EGI L10123]